MSSELHAHWTLDPDVTFLNHGSFGATPRAVLAQQSELRTQLERQPLRFFTRDYNELWHEARRRGAAFVGADLDGFTFVPNASSGVNTVLRSLQLSAGDEVVVTDHEYAACRNALDFVAQRSGATVRVVEIPLPIDGPDPIVAAIAGAITDRTKVVMFDHVTSQTGVVMPAAAIVASCRRHDVEVLIDGAHAPGMLDLDLAAIGADYYTGNFHKWVCTPKAAALLWVAERHRAKIRPLVISHGASMPADSPTDRFHHEFWWQGTFDPTPVFCIPFGIDHMASLVDGGWPEIRRRNHELVLAGRALLNEVLGEVDLVPASMVGSIATVRIPDGTADRGSVFDPDPDYRHLLDAGIEVPIQSWPRAPQRLLRVSAQLYNAMDDYERLGDVLGELFG